MLIAHLIGGVIIFASFLFRVPQASSTISLFLTTFKSAAPVSFLQQIEDIFSSSPTLIDSPSFYSDVTFSPTPVITDSAVCCPPFQRVNFGSAASTNVSADVFIQEIGQEKCFPSSNRGGENPASTSAAHFNIFLLLAPLCAILALYLAYVSLPGIITANAVLKETLDEFFPSRQHPHASGSCLCVFSALSDCEIPE